MRGVLQRFLVELHCHSSKFPHKAQRNGQDSIFLACDHDVVRKGLRCLLGQCSDVEIWGEALDGRQAVRNVGRSNADIVVMDIGMPLLNGIAAAAELTRQNPRIGVIILSMHTDQDYVLRALDAGVKGYLLKDTVASDLLHAIDAVRSGRTFFSPAIAQVLREDHLLEPRRKELPDPHYLLSEREKEILQLLAEGKSNKEVAAVLDVSSQTVETHRAIFMEKLNLHSAAEIVLYAVRKQMIT